VDLGGTRCHGALADLAGEVLFEDERGTRADGDPFDTLVSCVSHLRRSAGARRLPVLGVAIGIPAILDPGSGRAIGGPRVEWDDFEIVSRLSRALDVPFLVENDVNLAALAHAWRGAARGVDDFVVVSVGTGIGGVVVAGGRLVKGRHNAGGEVGYVTTERALLDVPVERGLGGLESVASGPAIARRAEELLRGETADGTGSVLHGRPVSAEGVFAAAAMGDPLARDVIAEAVDHLSLALTAVAATVDPELVILEGSIGRSLGAYVEDVRRRLRLRLPAPPEVLASTLRSATVVGGIAAALQLVREQRAPDALTATFRSLPRSGPGTAPLAEGAERGRVSGAPVALKAAPGAGGGS
jgi:predicted NBD/HSP70 family sugar kinase